MIYFIATGRAGREWGISLFGQIGQCAIIHEEALPILRGGDGFDVPPLVVPPPVELELPAF